MAKPSYKIPATLNRSVLDNEIELAAGGFRTKPLPLKVIFFWLITGLICMYVVGASPLAKSSLWVRIILVLWIISAGLYFGSWSKTKEMKFMMIPSLVQYFTPGSRKITTRRSSAPQGLMSVVRIRQIDDSGLIHFTDNTVGQLYSVVGSASALLFESDRDYIINRVDGFFRNIDTHTEWNFITTKEPQRVYRQLDNINTQRKNLKHKHPELYGLIDEKFDILDTQVGDQFSSTHQYLLLHSSSLDNLRVAHQTLRAETEGSSAMFKQCMLLNGSSARKLLRTIYAPRNISLHRKRESILAKQHKDSQRKDAESNRSKWLTSTTS